MSMILNKLRKKLPKFLGGKKLSDVEQMQAMVLACLKAIEVNTQLLIKSNGLMKPEMVAAQYIHSATLIEEKATSFPELSIEREGFLFMAQQIKDIAENVQIAYEELKV